MSYKIVNKIDKKDSLPLEFESEKAAEIYFESNGMYEGDAKIYILTDIYKR